MPPILDDVDDKGGDNKPAKSKFRDPKWIAVGIGVATLVIMWLAYRRQAAAQDASSAASTFPQLPATAMNAPQGAGTPGPSTSDLSALTDAVNGQTTALGNLLTTLQGPPASATPGASPTPAGSSVPDWWTQMYQGILNRAPDPQGAAFWAGETANVGQQQAMKEFMGSPEVLVQQDYQSILHRYADPQGLAFFSGELQSGQKTNAQIQADLAWGQARGHT